MKHLALLLLLLMAILFAVTLHRPEPWAGWLHAFAEAGMVGALADWFAVTALFRHPLGLPIPHTAIIPRRKNEIGENLARFVAEHFLDPEVVRNKLRSSNLALAGARWMRTTQGHDRLVNLIVSGLVWLLNAADEARVRRFISRISRRQLEQLDVTPLLGNTLAWLVRDGRHQPVLTQCLRYCLVMLHENRDQIRGGVQQESPWWMPGFVDDRIVVQMLDRIETLLLELSLDPEHPMRQQFDNWVERTATDLSRSRELQQWGENFKQGLLSNEALQDYLYELWFGLSQGLLDDLENEQSAVRQKLSSLLTALAVELENDEAMQAWVNQGLIEASVALVAEHRGSIVSLISDTIRNWDAADTSKRVEDAIGRDLQFIRINGTLVGGLVGLVIHAIKLI